ncbi:MAG TPA: LamG domain-containing protein [Steroidobacteraceae bacterium]|nr:LamG domain-containing protein [Steroidobacteraceae bacterium]
MNASGLIDTLRTQSLRVTRGRVTALAVLAASVLLAGCGAGSVQTAANPVAPPTTNGQSYNGPAPASADVQAFVVNFWNNVKATDRCGACHIQGNQSPMFARNDDVNLAYQAAQTVVDLTNPANSIIVGKVGGGHHCWLASNQACADTMTTWIKNWAGVTMGSSKATIQLVAPTLMDAGGSRTFPASSTLFAQTVYPLLTQYCSRCHSPSAATAQSPYFAQADVDAAYAAAQPKMNLDTPTLSRFYVRLHDEFHNCWGGDCAAASAQMLAAIQAFANQVPVTQVDPNWLLSKALTMYDGVVDNGGTRVETGLIAKFEFKTGTGTIAYDTSGVEPALNLDMSGDVTWVGGWGVQVQNKGKLQGTTTGSAKLHDMILTTGEYSVEAWVAPANVTQTMAYIVSYSGGTTQRNFTLGQTMYNYDAFLRSTTTNANGQPEFSTPSAQQVLQATLQHVVMTYDPVNGRQIYVNGQLVATGDPQKGGSLSQWDNTFALVLGNEVSSDRPFSGLLKMVAIYNRAMPAADVQSNFAAGVGERYYLLFNVDKFTGLNQTYVMFEVSEYDSYSYLFNKPVFLSLDPTVNYSGLVVKGMRIGINGMEAPVGQAYAPLNTTVSGQGFDPTTSPLSAVALSSVGTTIALQKGPSYDQFFLTFEQLGTATNVHTDATPIAPIPTDSPRPADVGVRTFEQINTSLSTMTTVPKTNAAASALYHSLQQSLPATPSFVGFVSSHQTAIAQLSIQYCDALVRDPNLSAAYFPGLNFGAAPAAAYDTNGRNALITPLIDHMLSANSAAGKFLASQPTAASVRTELNALIDKLSASVSADTTGTATIAKAACAAVAGSSAMLVQ